jgi:hypothetical protein
MRRDNTNFWKALLDALKGIVITDDCEQVIPDVRYVSPASTSTGLGVRKGDTVDVW